MKAHPYCVKRIDIMYMSSDVPATYRAEGEMSRELIWNCNLFHCVNETAWFAVTPVVKVVFVKQGRLT